MQHAFGTVTELLNFETKIFVRNFYSYKCNHTRFSNQVLHIQIQYENFMCISSDVKSFISHFTKNSRSEFSPEIDYEQNW